MKGFWRHIAASASITAVFLVCALALAVSAVPAEAPPPPAPRGSQGAFIGEAFTGLVETLKTVCDEVPQPAPDITDSKAEAAAQPAPATAAPAAADKPSSLLAPRTPWLSALN
jgi:hypothetical protein